MMENQFLNELENLMLKQKKITEEMEKITRELTQCSIEKAKTEIQAPKDSIPKMMTLKQASGKTGISYNMIRNLCLRDEITYVKSGSKYLVNFGSLVDFLNGGARDD